MGVYTIVFANADDFDVYCDDANITNARNGTGTLTAGATSASTLTIGEGVGPSFHRVGQGFFSFDTSSVASVSAIELRTRFPGQAFPPGGTTSSDTRTIEAARYEWSGSGTGDFRSTAALGALTVWGSKLSATATAISSGGVWIIIPGLTSEFASSSAYKLVVYDQKQRTAGTAPSFVWYLTHSTDATGTTSDPYLILTSGTPWSIVGVSNVVEVTTASHALVTTGISGLAQGDLMIACISSRIASATAVTLPTGGEWTLCNQRNANNTATNNSATSSATMAFCVRGASNPNLTFTHPVAPSVAIGRIVAYRCAGPIGPNTVASVNSVTPTATTIGCSWTAVTSMKPDDLLVVLLSGGQEALFDFVFGQTTPAIVQDLVDTTTPPTLDLMIPRAESVTTTGADTSLAIYDGIPRGSTSTGTLGADATVSAAHTMIAQAFSILQSVDDAWNILDKSSNITLSSSDKVATWMTTADAGVRSTQTRMNGTAGKFYAEMVFAVSAVQRFGITPVSNSLTSLLTNFFYRYSDGAVIVNNSSVGNIGAGATNDVLGIAWDAGAEKVWFRRNAGNWNASGTDDPATGAGGFDCSFAASTAHALWAHNSGAAGSNVAVRTELVDYTQDVPNGFTSWMGETPPVPRRQPVIRPTEAVARSFRW